MPAATTHALFAKDVYKQLPKEIQHRINNFPLFLLGSQGPDVLLFSGASLLPGTLKKYGNLLHEEKVYETLSFFQEAMEEDPLLCNYYYGYLCHYALDAFAHPLINAIAHDTNKKRGIHKGEAHVSSEADIDIWMLHQRGKDIMDYDVYHDMKITNEEALALAKVYRAMFLNIFNIDITEKKLLRTMHETAFLTRVLAPQERWKYPLIKKLESLVGLPHAISGMMLNKPHSLKVLNLSHHAYPLAHDDTKTIQASFPELYGKALTFAKKIISTLSKDDIKVNFNGESN